MFWKSLCDSPDSRRPTVGRETGGPRRAREDTTSRGVAAGGDSAHGPVVKTKRVPSAASSDEWAGHLAAGHAEYRGGCPFCVAGKKKEAHRQIHGHPERQLDYAWVGRASPVMVANSRRIDGWSPTKCRARVLSIGKLVNEVIMSGVQTLVVKSGQEASIIDVKNSLMRELRGVEGLQVLPEKSPVGASAAITEFSGQVVSRFQRSVSNGKTAYERWKQKSYREALVRRVGDVRAHGEAQGHG